MQQFHLFETHHPDAMYFLGAMATDGNVYGNRPKLDQADEPWLLAIKNRLWPEATIRKTAEQVWVLENEDGEILETSANSQYLTEIQAVSVPGSQVRRKRQALYTLQRRENQLVSWLAKFGVVPKKSLTLEFPLNIPTNSIRDFVRGVIDGDGSIWIHNYRQTVEGKTVYEYQYAGIAIVSASKPFLEGLGAAINSQIEGGVTTSIFEKESGGNALVPQCGSVYVLRISCWSAYKVLRWLYYSPALLCLERKRRTAEQIFDIYADPSKRDVDAVRQEIADACELRLHRMSYGLIAQVVGIPRDRVKNHCKNLPQIEATQFLDGRRTDPTLIAECRKLRNEGWSLYLISDLVGVHPATVFDNVKDIKVKTRFTKAGSEELRKEGIERIISLGKLGWSEAMIVAETGFTKYKVRSWLATIPDRVRSLGLRKEVTPEIISRIELLYDQGKSRKMIATEINRSDATVKKYISAYRKRQPD